MFHASAISFTNPHVATNAPKHVLELLSSGKALSGDGFATKDAHVTLAELFGSHSLLTHSCTAALEMAVILSNCGPGDEVIVPSYTFTSTATAIAMRGAQLVFVDVDSHDLNMSLEATRDAITSKTKAIMVVHYGGVPAQIEEFANLSSERGLVLIEDAAQGIGVKVSGKHLGTFGDFGCISFHATKNIQCGEGGSLICRDPSSSARAEIIREKGTDRSSFLRGEVDKYTWRDLGSSYLPSDLVAAYLLPQLDDIDEVNSGRVDLWNYYKEKTADWAARNGIRIVAKETGHLGNGHIFAFVMPTLDARLTFMEHMKIRGIGVSPHYVPLHATPAGEKYGRAAGSMQESVLAGQGLIRIPMHKEAQDSRARIVEAILEFKI